MNGIRIRNNYSFGGCDLIIDPSEFNFNGWNNSGVFLHEIKRAIVVLNNRIGHSGSSTEFLNILNTDEDQDRNSININIRHFLHCEENSDSVVFVFSDSSMDTPNHQLRINVKFFANSENHLDIELFMSEDFKLLS